MQTVNVGHKIEMTITYLDQNGNPMQVTPTPDSKPTWADAPSTAGIDTLVVASDGLSAELDALAAGSDTVTLTVLVGGATFTATLAVQISPAPQVLTTVQISPTVV